MISSLRQFQRFKAAFKPKRTDDLKPGSEAWIGHEGVWETLWIIETGPYEGQWACSLATGDGVHDPVETTKKPPFIWVPQCDLEPSK